MIRYIRTHRVPPGAYLHNGPDEYGIQILVQNQRITETSGYTAEVTATADGHEWFAHYIAMSVLGRDDA